MRLRCLRCHMLASIRYPCQICGSTRHIFRYLAYLFADSWGWNQSHLSQSVTNMNVEINITPTPVQTAWETNQYKFLIEHKGMLRR